MSRPAVLAFVLGVGAAGCFGNDLRQNWEPPNTDGGTATRWKVTDQASGAILGEGCIASPHEPPMSFFGVPGQIVDLSVSVQSISWSKPRDLQRCQDPCDCDPDLTRIGPAQIINPECWTAEHGVGSACLERDFHTVEVLSAEKIPRDATEKDCLFTGDGYKVTMRVNAAGPACFAVSGGGGRQRLTVNAR